MSVSPSAKGPGGPVRRLAESRLVLASLAVVAVAATLAGLALRDHDSPANPACNASDRVAGRGFTVRRPAGWLAEVARDHINGTVLPAAEDYWTVKLTGGGGSHPHYLNITTWPPAALGDQQQARAAWEQYGRHSSDGEGGSRIVSGPSRLPVAGVDAMMMVTVAKSDGYQTRFVQAFHDGAEFRVESLAAADDVKVEAPEFNRVLASWCWTSVKDLPVPQPLG
jgi:hypothetical protein